ncbi:hypothetical protein ON010_g5782 [Phytophthora cinnamomi]|nr:hypothetical protein ON010_g5782 [Phytophthora cinnamomi]
MQVDNSRQLSLPSPPSILAVCSPSRTSARLNALQLWAAKVDGKRKNFMDADDALKLSLTSPTRAATAHNPLGFLHGAAVTAFRDDDRLAKLKCFALRQAHRDTRTVRHCVRGARNAVPVQRQHNDVLRLESDAAGASDALRLGSGAGDADLGADVASAQTLKCA